MYHNKSKNTCLRLEESNNVVIHSKPCLLSSSAVEGPPFPSLGGLWLAAGQLILALSGQGHAGAYGLQILLHCALPGVWRVLLASPLIDFGAPLLPGKIM